MNNLIIDLNDHSTVTGMPLFPNWMSDQANLRFSNNMIGNLDQVQAYQSAANALSDPLSQSGHGPSHLELEWQHHPLNNAGILLQHPITPPGDHITVTC